MVLDTRARSVYIQNEFLKSREASSGFQSESNCPWVSYGEFSQMTSAINFETRSIHFSSYLASGVFIGVALLAVLMGTSDSAFAQASSVESSNPFNEFMSPAGGVNLFSGDVAFSHPLYTLRGVGGINVPVVVQYSGNVHLNVRARNDRAPTEWVGLGWRLGFGNIHCDHNGTGVLVDDRCFYVSPKGVSQEILKLGGKHFLEKDPYWKVEPQPSTDGAQIIGWVLTDISGKKFRYGDFSETAPAEPNATRYVFWWKETSPVNVNYVGSGFSGTPGRYSYHWDLSEEVDIDGNVVRYGYEQVRKRVKSGDWTSAVEYTQASYLQTIQVPGGGKIVFETKMKSKDEVIDPESQLPEPDAFMEFFEEKYLERIRVENINQKTIRSFLFGYDVGNFQKDRAAGYSKRFLTAITESGADGKAIGIHRFGYSKDAPENLELPLGVLTSIETPLCGTVQYALQRKSIEGTKKIFPCERFGRFEKNSRVVGGRMRGGEEYVVVINGKDGEDKANEVIIYNNEDGVWTEHLVSGLESNSSPRRLGLPNGRGTRVVTGEDFFAVIKDLGGGEHSISIFMWNHKAWVSTNILGRKKTLLDLNSPSVLVEKNMLVISRFMDASSAMEIFTYHRQGEDWIEKEIKNLNTIGFPSLRNNHLMIAIPGPGILVKTWNGVDWSTTMEINSEFPTEKFVLGSDYIFSLAKSSQPILGVDLGTQYYTSSWHWTGREWLETFWHELDTEGASFSDDDLPDIQGVGNGYVVVRSDDKDHLHLYQYTGEKWRTALNRNMVNSDLDWDEAYWRGDVLDDCLLIRYPRIKWRRRYWVVPVKELDEDAQLVAFNRVGSKWVERDFGTLGYPNTAKKPILGQDVFVHNSNPANAQVWNGSSWNQADWHRGFKRDAMSMISGSLIAEKVDGELNLFRKFQNSLVNPVYAYVVTSKIVFDPIRGQKSDFTYDYGSDQSRFDIRASTAKFHKVTAHLPDHGSRVFWFHNGYTGPVIPSGTTQASSVDWRELTGNIYREEDINSSGKKVAERNRTFEVFRRADTWPANARQIRLKRSETESNRVLSGTDIEYNPSNGLVRKVIESGSGGRKRITTTKFAHEVVAAYGAMGVGGKHMLAQVAETDIYENTVDDSDPKSSQVTTWSADTRGIWHATQSWIWNGGAPGSGPFAPFSHTSLSSNGRPWRLTNTVTKRDAIGRPLQTTAPNGMSSCATYGNRGLFLIAESVNSPCDGVGILTGDFDDPGSEYVDETNHWKQNDATLDQIQSRYGGASLRIPVGGKGPSKRVGPLPAGRDYYFSAWVYPIAVSTGSPVALIVKPLQGSEILPTEGRFGNLQPGSTAGWQKVERVISASELDEDTLEVSVKAEGAAEFSVQEIRFVPAISQTTSRFLENNFFAPAALVSPAGAAEYYEYDSAMRLAKTYGEDELGKKALRTETEYHLNACAGLQTAGGTLSRLKVTAGTLAFDKQVREYGELWVDPMQELVTLEFTAENSHEDVQIKVGTGSWNTPCCRGNNSQDVILSGTTTKVEIKVGTGEPYKITFRKASTCWTPLGGQVSGGWGGTPSSATTGSDQWVAYSADQDGGRLRVKKWDGVSQVWTEMGGPISAGEAATITLKVLGGVPYVAYVDEFPVPQPDGSTLTLKKAVIKRWSDSSWTPLQGDGTVSNGPTRFLAFETHGTDLWTAYVGNKKVEEGGGTGYSVYVRKWTGGAWTRVGDQNADGIADGLVSDGEAKSVTLAIHPDGTPHVGYLGRVRFPEGVDGQPAGSYTSPFPVVKKLIHAGGRDFWGDLVSGTDEPTQQGEVLEIPGVDKLQLSFGGNDLYLGLAYQYMAPVPGEDGMYERSGRRVLDIRKLRDSSQFTDRSHWFPMVSGDSPEDYAVAPLDGSGDFHFSAASGTPSLAFVTAQNNQRLTVLNFSAGHWTAVGNPAFVPSDATAGLGRLSLATAGTGNPLSVLRQEDLNTESSQFAIRALQFEGGCSDLTLAQLLVFDGGQPIPLDWKFRPYILSHEGKIRAETGAVGLSIAPNSLTALSKVWILAPDGSSQVWEAASGNSLPDRFPVVLQPGSNVIQVELVSSDSHQRLRYQVRLERRPTQEAGGTVKIEDFVFNPPFDIGTPGVYRVLVPADKPSIFISVDVSTDRTIFVNGQSIGNNEQIEVHLADGTTIIKMVLVDANGVRTEYDIQVIRGEAAQAVTPLLEEVLQNPNGTFTARFGYSNPNPQVREIPVGALNGMQYHGSSGQDLGQVTRFETGVVHNAFSVVFDGTTLTWFLDGQSVTANADIADPSIRVEIREPDPSKADMSEPKLRVTNLSQQSLQGFKLSLWLSRAEVPYQEVVADPYYFNPVGVGLTVSVHPANGNLVRVDLAFPTDYALPSGASTGPEDIYLGLHFRSFYPGHWERSNDWSWQGAGSEFIRTPFVTVYDAQGRLIAGREPDPISIPQPPSLSQGSVFSMDQVWPWSATIGGLSGSSVRKTEGLAGLQVHGTGYVEISHLPMNTADITGETNRLLLDFYLPNGQSNPWWKGQVQLFVDCPSANWYNTNIGSLELTPLSDGTFSTLEFSLSDAVLNILRGNHNDFRFKFVLSVNQASELPVLDNVRFGGTPVPPDPPPGDPPSPPGTGGATFFSMDDVSRWQASVGGLSQNTVRRTEGTGAVQIEGTGYIEVAHTVARTLDITGETSRLQVDFYLPNGQSSPWWKGQVQLFIDCPSANWYNTGIGSKELTPLPDGSFSTLEFTLSEAVLNVLRGDFNDFRFKWFLSINQASEKPVLDNMRFAP